MTKFVVTLKIPPQQQGILTCPQNNYGDNPLAIYLLLWPSTPQHRFLEHQTIIYHHINVPCTTSHKNATQYMSPNPTEP